MLGDKNTGGRPMIPEDHKSKVAWLEAAIAESGRRIAWNNQNRWFEASDDGWVDVTDRENSALQSHILTFQILLDATTNDL